MVNLQNAMTAFAVFVIVFPLAYAALSKYKADMTRKRNRREAFDRMAGNPMPGITASNEQQRRNVYL